jgi:plasmid stabilization system protein ParE
MIIFHPKAEQEYAEAINYYKEINTELGNRFKKSIKNILSNIQQSPKIYPFVDSEIQKAVSIKFPYIVLFAKQNKYTIILAIFHTKRDIKNLKRDIKDIN